MAIDPVDAHPYWVTVGEINVSSVISHTHCPHGVIRWYRRYGANATSLTPQQAIDATPGDDIDIADVRGYILRTAHLDGFTPGMAGGYYAQRRGDGLAAGITGHLDGGGHGAGIVGYHLPSTGYLPNLGDGFGGGHCDCLGDGGSSFGTNGGDRARNGGFLYI